MDIDQKAAKPDKPAIYGRTDLTYNDYLKVPELLNLQVPQSQPAHHDEMLFIIIHQSYELWFKLLLHEIDQANEHIQNKEILMAHHFLKRVVEIMKMLVNQIHILETMRPVDFLRFRDRLTPASGFQSLQFRELEFRAGLKDESYLVHFQNRPDLKASLETALSKPSLRDRFRWLLSQISPPSQPEELIEMIYQSPADSLPLYLLCETLIEFDEYLMLWRTHHMKVVERIIGFKQGTGGSSGAHYLNSTIGKKCFPELWEVRTKLK